MDWNRRGSNAAVAPRQYLAPNSSAATAIQSQAVYSQPGQFSHNLLLQNLLQAQNTEDFTKAQKAALNFRTIKPRAPASQVPVGQPSLTYNSVQQADPQSGIIGQHPAGANYRTPAYANPAQQAAQQSQTITQQFGANGFSATAAQQLSQNPQPLRPYQSSGFSAAAPQQTAAQNSQLMTNYPTNGCNVAACQQPAAQPPTQNSQLVTNYASSGFNVSAHQQPASQQPAQNSQVQQNYHPSAYNVISAQQNYQPNVNIKYPQQSMLRQNPFTSTGQSSNSVQTPYQQMAPNGQNALVSYVSTQQVPTVTNTAATMTGYRNTIATNPTAANGMPLAHANLAFQQVPVGQRQNGFENQSAQPLNNAMNAVKPPPAYNQPPPVYNQPSANRPTLTLSSVVTGPIQQNLVSQRQTYAAPGQTSATAQSQMNELQLSTEQELYKLMKICRNVKRKYELLNQINNLYRQGQQAMVSQENAGSSARAPPLISSLGSQRSQVMDMLTSQLNLSQAVPVPNPQQANAGSNFSGQNVYENASVSSQPNTHQPQSTHMPVDSQNLCRQNNFVFSGQTKAGNDSSSTLQSPESEPLITRRPPKVQRTLIDQSTFNPSNENVSHNTSVPSKDRFCTTGTNGNGQHTSVSWEAIEASLPLWMSTPTSSSESTHPSTATGLTSSTLEDCRLLEEVSRSLNEFAPAAPAQKPDSANPNQANPQVAIVSPLVQTKQLLPESCLLSKVCLQSPDVKSGSIEGSVTSHENESFDKILRMLETIESNTVGNVGASRPKETLEDASLLPSSTVPPSQNEHEQNLSNDVIEIIDDSLQITSVCTLVEGNTLYDSSVALMFESSPTKGGSELLKHIKREKTEAPSSTCSYSDKVTVKKEPSDDGDNEPCQMHESSLHCAGVPSLDVQADQTVAPISEAYNDLQSSAISDQLTDLLTEFPYGIKDYIAEGLSDSIHAPSGSPTDRPVVDKVLLPSVSSKSQEEDVDQSDGNKRSEVVFTLSTDVQPTSENISAPKVNMESSTPKEACDLRAESELELTVDRDVDETYVPTDTASEDGFEIISDSPISSIHITLLDPEEISNIFPDEQMSPDTEKAKEIKLEKLQPSESTEKPQMELPSQKKNSDTETGEEEKDMFCCLFSWLTHTNGNAPKCKCKKLEFSKEQELSAERLKPVSANLQTLPSPQRSDPVLPNLKPKVLKTMQPVDTPPKLDLMVPNTINHYLQPMDKPPILEPVVSPAKGLQTSSQISIVQKESILKNSSLVNGFQIKDNAVCNEKHLATKPGKGEPKHKKKSRKIKADGSRKSEKLIVKTDFLRLKHKEKRSDEEKTSGNRNSHDGSLKSSEVEPRKRPQGERESATQTVSENVEQPFPKQQGDESRNRSRFFHEVEKSSQSYHDRKHKEKESHSEQTVNKVEQYLARKRKIINKRLESRTEPREPSGDARQMHVENPSSEQSNKLKNITFHVKRPSSAKYNGALKTKDIHANTSKTYYRPSENRQQSKGPSESGHRKLKDSPSSHKKELVKKILGRKLSSYKDKLYLSPCVGSKPSYQNLAKLQIGHYPNKPAYVERRKSLESPSYARPSNSSGKNETGESPKMLQFKLCPEFDHGSPKTQAQSEEEKSSKAQSIVEGIKSSKEAWCSSVPFKKRKMEGFDSQGFQALLPDAQALAYKPLEKTSARPAQNTQLTFNLFRQRYQEQRSRSLDGSLSNL
ncbi:retroelement silencing factor 1 isoform X2 [Hyperolius riggenbachi]